LAVTQDSDNELLEEILLMMDIKEKEDDRFNA